MNMISRIRQEINDVGSCTLDAEDYNQLQKEWILRVFNKEKDKEFLKGVTTDFFYWWSAQPGNNTQEGFDDWWERHVKTLEEGN